MRFNTKNHESFFNKVKEDAIKRYGFTEDEMKRCDLSYLHKKTKSKRILRYINLAYHLGVLRGIKDCDSVFHTEFTTRKITPEDKVKQFHTSRVMFAILNGRIEHTTDDARGHKEWLTEDYNLTDAEFESTTRGYMKDGNIVFYKGSNFTYDSCVEVDANIYSHKIAKMYKIEEINVYVGVEVGEIGEIWTPDKYLYKLVLEK